MGKSSIQTKKAKKELNMRAKTAPQCGQHHVSKEWRQTTFEYNDGEISVQVPNVYAWVCPVDGEASFTPETVDELITSVREFIETAKRTRNRQSTLREYIISVG
jgi:YgiT-type zinc finger domain-containing protein